MTPIIPQWAYPVPPAGWVRFGGFRRPDAARECEPVWRGRVPVWASWTNGIQDGDYHLLIIRVLPEIEVVLATDEIECDDPRRVATAIENRTSVKRWPARNWRLSHLVYVTHVVKKPKPDGKATLRLCGARLPDAGGKLQQLAFLQLPRVPVSIVPAAKKDSTEWNIEIQLNEQPNSMPTWYDFVVWMALYEPWERTMAFRALGHLMPEALKSMLETTCERIIGRIQNIGQPNKPDSFQLSSTTLNLLHEAPELYDYQVKGTTIDEAGSDMLFSILTGLTRMPMPVSMTGGKEVVSAQEILNNLIWISPHLFDMKGRVPTAGAVRSQSAIDMRLDKSNTLQLRYALLPPHYPDVDSLS